MGRLWFGLALLAGGASMTEAAPPSVHGLWGAPGASLKIDADAVLLEQSCGRVAIEPIRPDRAGRFTARARIEQDQPGPQPADAASPAAKTAKVAGVWLGDTLDLTITTPGVAPEQFRFERGRRSKIIRCY